MSLSPDRKNKTPARKLASCARSRAKRFADPAKRQESLDYMKQYKLDNRDRLNERNRTLYKRNRVKIQLQRKGIEPTQELIDLIEGHDGFCDICATEEPCNRWGTFQIDHCHRTGRFRGMLCSECNKGLGMFQDNPSTMRQAARYLEGE